MIVAAALPGMPEVRPGDDLARLLAEAAGRLPEAWRVASAASAASAAPAAGPPAAVPRADLLAGRSPAAGPPAEGDVIVVAHKVVSKSEGRVVALDTVEPSERAIALGAEHGKDPRLIELILHESSEIVRSRPGVLICRTRHGFVCANAGVDASNAEAPGEAVLLPLDPDASARALRARLRELTGVAPAIVITDSFGRAWRLGQCDVAIGIAGLRGLEDWRGRQDAVGRVLEATVIAIADEAAAAADLARAKDSREPAVLVRGLERHVTAVDGPGAAAVLRDRDEDLFL